MRGGITDMSLRELAAAIGTSHRMLLYHFGSREGLLTAVACAVEESQRADVSELITATPAGARRLWQHFSDPQLWPGVTEAFERYLQHAESIYTRGANQPVQPSPHT
jgi:AcrR family transcriptional regulator